MRSTFFLTCFAFLLGACGSASANHRRHHTRSSAAIAAAAKENNPTSGTPVSDFAASASLPAAGLAAAAKKAKKAGQKYQISQGSKSFSTIYTDWADFNNSSAYVWTADMDIDCDGIDFNCKGNSDGQPQTDYGALAAYQVPFIVIPGNWVNGHSKELPGNNVAAVICGGKMYYGIFGDTNGATPEVIGEASYRMGTACFPNDHISGANGHGAMDVTYIVFTGKDAVLPSTDMTKNYITQFSKLKSMGDEFVTQLSSNLGLSSGEVDTAIPADTCS
ncbi:glycoside hydrolase family 75 protein [Piloderma croceum F 1598]|uniref:Endo-chitosanase n=1 Tax=Piloderma croceum (strain F 1598) TaxID=765440 RepID=A0A0C3B2U4_PILCF|nr:glycoside hydrolase family 75 protein [Piloderma croceum F 1598]